MKLIGFSPDRETTEPGVVLDGNLFYPTMRGIRALPILEDTIAPSLSEGVAAAYISRTSTGSPQIITQVGTTKQWVSDGATWVDVTGPSPRLQGFLEFGEVTIGYSEFSQMVERTTGAFAYIADSPITKIVFGTDNGFLIGANGYRPSNTTFQDQWFASAQFDYTTWTPAVNNVASDGRLFFPPGPITAGESLGQYGVLYKRNAIFIGEYTGPTTKWLWNGVPGSVGCIEGGSLVKAEGAHYFLGSDDFYRFDGTRPVPISTSIRKWVFEEKDGSQFSDIQGAYDPRRKIIVWTWTAAGGKTGVCYSLVTGQWGRCEYEGTMIQNAHNIQFLDDSAGFITGQFSAGLMMFSDTGQLQYTKDTFGSAKVLAGDIGHENDLVDLTRIRMRFARPPLSGQAQIHYRDSYTGISKEKSAVLKTDRFDQTVKANWIRPELTLTGDWELLDISLPAPTRKQTVRAHG